MDARPQGDKVRLRQRGIAQGLKPFDAIALIGMTEVMPFYKTFLQGGFVKLRLDEHPAFVVCRFGASLLVCAPLL